MAKSSNSHEYLNSFFICIGQIQSPYFSGIHQEPRTKSFLSESSHSISISDNYSINFNVFLRFYYFISFMTSTNVNQGGQVQSGNCSTSFISYNLITSFSFHGLMYLSTSDPLHITVIRSNYYQFTPKLFNKLKES